MEKQRWEGSEKRREEKKKEDQRRERVGGKGRKVAKHCVFPMICVSSCVFPMICVSRGSKSRLAKAAGAEPSGQMRDEKMHAIVARSAFPSQNAKDASASEHFLKLMPKKCTPLWRDARFKVKSAKADGFSTPLRREAQRQVKMHKAHQVRSIFGS